MDNELNSSNNVTAEDLGVDEIVYDAINVDVIGFGALNVDKLYKVGHIAEIKESACNVGDLGSIPGWGRSPGEGNCNPLQYSCLEKNPMDRGAW